MEMEALKIAISIPFDISYTHIYINIPENLCKPVMANIQPCRKGTMVVDKDTAGTVKGSSNSENPEEKGRIDIEALRKELPPVSNDELPDLSDGKKWYYNTRTGDIEHGKLSSFTHRMGPYDTREDAERALKIARARNDIWEAEDKEWAGDDFQDTDSPKEASRTGGSSTDHDPARNSDSDNPSWI